MTRLVDKMWFLQAEEKQELTDFETNNLPLEDEAVIGSKKKKYIEETDCAYEINKNKKKLQTVEIIPC